MGSKSLVSHWNLLVDMCDTEYLIMASDDDVYEPQFLEEIDTLTQKYPKVDLFRSRVKKIDGKGELLAEDLLMAEYQKQLDFLYYFFHFDNMKCIANYVFKSVALKTKGGFYNLPLAWGSDDATVVLLSKQGICHTPSLNFSFRNSGINISSTVSPQIMREKTREIYILLQFIDNYLVNIRKNIQTKFEHEQYKSIVKSINSGFYIKSLFYGAELSPLKEMMIYYRYLSSKGLFKGKLDKLHFFWSWIRAY